MSMNCLSSGPTTVRSADNIGNMWNVPEEFQMGRMLASCSSLPAKIYLARHKYSGKNVVVKKYNIDKLSATEGGEDEAHYIRHEVASMRLFNNVHLLHCLSTFVVNHEVWLVTPLMGFGSVKDVLLSSGGHLREGLPELACAFIIRDVLHALQYLHSQGVVHRSVRASHILIQESGRVLLGGFRYCTLLHATGEHRTNLYDYPLHGIGTNLHCLAPEILQQNLLGYNETSDIYSLGVTCCEMANGITPYSDFPATLMLIEKLRGAAPRLMDANTLTSPNQEGELGGFPGHPADSGVGESVASCNLVGKDSTYFTREFSPSFHNFIRECLSLHSNDRPSAADLLVTPFIKQLKKTTSTLIGLLQPLQPIALEYSQELPDQDDGGMIVEQMESLSVGEQQEMEDWDF